MSNCTSDDLTQREVIFICVFTILVIAFCLYELQSKWDTCCECCEVFFGSNTDKTAVESHNNMDMFEMFNLKGDCNKATQTDYEISPSKHGHLKKVNV